MSTFLQDYQRRETIHEDSNTVIYRGVREPDQTPVLIKCLKTDYPTLEDIARLKHEYKILQSLNQAGVVKAYALADSHRALALILEDFGGEPLSRILARMIGQRSLPFCEFLPLAIQLADTLAQLHQNQIVHKNVKSANILLNPVTGQAKIADFSIATHLSRENQTIGNPNLLEGTLAYMSPEQTGRMNRLIDYRTDFYSLGIVFYELLTGQLPFQATEPLEVVHCHIAKAPRPPQELNPEIPQAVSDIVMKLLAKTAEDRYQNALGLKADLEACLRMLQAAGEVADFQVGQLDLYSQFSIPQKLYGREGEVQTLMDAFERVSSGATEMMLVSGYSGIGKSSLVYEVHKPIVRQRGYFIAGKFDQFKRNIPYAAFIQAFQELMRQLLTEHAHQVASWRAKLEAALGPNGQVIIDVIPEVERIVGRQPPVPQLGATESQNRFNRVFQQFIHVFCKPEHPMVLFLDDLQWADSASLKLIQLLMNDPDSQYLLLMGAYRDNEVSPTHPLMLTLEEIQKEKAVVNNIVLQPLHLVHVKQLVGDTLRSDLKRSRSLAELVFSKTQGNPFFLTQLLKSLYQDTFLSFDFNQGRWQWDIEVLQGIDITDNVVELMINQIQKQSTATQNILKLAACVGDKFTLEVLSIVNEKSLSDTAFDLWESLQVGLVLPLSQSYKIPLVLEPEATILEGNNQTPLNVKYKFLHDRVQQAAYALIPEGQKKQTHLKIGQLLLEHTAQTDLEENVFEIVNQLNIGSDLVSHQSEKDELARLNLIAGRKAKEATAYEPAVRYLTVGLGLLSETSWETNYELTLELYVEATEAEFLNINFERSVALGEVVLRQARTILDKVKVYETQIRFCISQNKLKEAIAIDLQVLDMMGITLLHDLPNALTQRYETALTLEELSNLPQMTDPYKLAALRILRAAGPPTYFTDAELFQSVIFTMVDLCIQHGNSALAAYAYGCYGLILAASMEEIDAGYQACQLALKFLDQYDAKDFKAEVYEIYNIHVRHFKEPLVAALEDMEVGIQSGLEVGQIQYVSFIAGFYCSCIFLTGNSLEVIAQKQDKQLSLLGKLKTQFSIDFANVWRQTVANLAGESEEKCRLIGKYFNEVEMLATLMEADSRTSLFCLYLAKANLFYLYKDYAQAVENARIAEDYKDGVLGMMSVSVHNFYYSLSLLALYPNAQPSEQRQYLEKVEWQQRWLETLAYHSPMNHLHKYQLVEAEKARVLGQNDKAMECYDWAIQGARKQGFIQEEALAAELAAEFYFQRGRERVARDYLTESYHAYLRWGATAKVGDLLERYPHVFSQIRKQEDLTLENRQITYTTELGATSLDLATVMKATQAISDEIVLDKLLDKLMNSLIENAGARTGLLLLERSGQWVLVAEGFADRENVIVLPSKPIEACPGLPLGLINYAARSQSTLVLNDATQEGLFSNDAYVIKNQPKSVLCLPIIYQSQLKGILYLENNLTKGAFTQERLEVLSLLSSQAAISLENAGLYQELQIYSQKLESKNAELIVTNESLSAEIAERQRVEKEREQLLVREQTARAQAEAANRFKDEFLAVLSHELRSPLNPILGWVKFLRDGKLDPAASERALEIIERNAKLQAKLIEDLLDVSRILRGKLSFNVSPTGLSSTIAAALETVRLAAEAKSIQIQTRLDPSVGQVLGDANRLQQVVWNLLSNAVKFSNPGGRVEVSLERAGTHAIIRVSDTGIGIGTDFLPHVFDYFRQADSATTRKYGGLGLGLAIVRQLVELHGGTVEAESPGEGLGASFSVKLPLMLGHSQTIPEERPPADVADLRGMRILVVDDDADTREFTVFMLEQSGAQVTAVASGVEALAALSQFVPDLLLSDIGMPDMDGYMLMRLVRSLPPEQGGQIRAIALSGYAGEADYQQALGCGFSSHVTKPVEPVELVEVISNLVGSNRNRHAS